MNSSGCSTSQETRGLGFLKVESFIPLIRDATLRSRGCGTPPGTGPFTLDELLHMNNGGKLHSHSFTINQGMIQCRERSDGAALISASPFLRLQPLAVVRSQLCSEADL